VVGSGVSCAAAVAAVGVGSLVWGCGLCRLIKRRGMEACCKDSRAGGVEEFRGWTEAGYGIHCFD
jgi:hypothetical protein